jgi:hypothetical protein
MPYLIRDLLAILGAVAAIFITVHLLTESAYKKGYDKGVQNTLVTAASDKDLLNKVCTAWWFSPEHKLSKKKP